MLAGGSRSGKTLLFIRAIVARALKAPGSRHAVLRYRFGHVKQSIVHDTFPKVLKACFPTVRCEINRSDMYAALPGGSEVWFGGLDDKERTEKILGTEYATILLNECSQIPYGSRNIAMTRLAQLVQDTEKKQPLALKMYYDENPPDKGHWTYRMFKSKQDPESHQFVSDPENYAFLQMNPRDNLANLPPDYIKTLESLSPRLRKRFLEGEFRDSNPNALFIEEVIDRWRITDETLPDMLRVVVAVDPSGADDENNVDNDEIGIIVAGLGLDGNGYVLEDMTCKAGPATWGAVVARAFESNEADRVIGEVNYGGAMVRAVIHAARPRTPFRAVHATRGKAVRAEPISSLFETGKFRLAGLFPELEDEMYAMTTHGFTGDHSPNRLDAMVWAATDLFPDLLKHDEKPKEVSQPMLVRRSKTAWMRQ